MAAWQKKPKSNDSLCNYTVKNSQTHQVTEIVQNTHENVKPETKQKEKENYWENRLQDHRLKDFPINLLNGTD